MQPHNTTHLRKFRPLADRFWEKVNKDGPIHPILETQCWIWTGARNPAGYGKITYGTKEDGTYELGRAHRVSYELTYGPIPEGMVICHKCDNPPCVNPNHLFVGSLSDNSLDAARKGRWQSPALKGEKCGMSKLSESDVVEIRQMLADGIPRVVIARQKSVTRNNIGAISRRETWKHIP